MLNYKRDIILFIETVFNDSEIRILEESDSLDVFIDCFSNTEFELTLLIMDNQVSFGKIEKNAPFGDFSPFEITIKDFEEVKEKLREIIEKQDLLP